MSNSVTEGLTPPFNSTSPGLKLFGMPYRPLLGFRGGRYFELQVAESSSDPGE